MNSIFKGTGVAMVTPFNEDYSIDFDSLTKLVEHLIQGGVDYLVVMGTTAESPTLSMDEKQAVLQHVIKYNAYRLPIVFGIGGNNTAEITNTLKSFDLKGVSGILSVSPYYNKPSQEGIYRHYMALAEASPLPIIIYNVPGRTGSNISASTTLRLARDSKKLVAVKEASGNMEQIMQIKKDAPENFLVISGDDAITMPLISCGIDGVISVVGNAFPKEFSDMVRAATANDYETARKLHYMLLDPIRMMFAEGNPGGVKAFLNQMGILKNVLRLPAYKVSDKLFEDIKTELNKIKK
ncbi:MAG: 4-hydroxy-tetrahydrodipicolinate synthase [Bacteroidales bacterium]|nr:4-hydroxy-tetrahydrodipicolinate synthase [Bacteroidales bacterium]